MEIEAIWLTLKVAFYCSIISLPIAIFFGYIFARKNFLGKTIIESIFNLPLVLPPITVGYILLITLGRNSTIGGFFNEVLGIQLSFSFIATIIAAIIVSFPLVFRSIKIAFELVDTKYESAAKTLGAGRLRTFFTISLPLAMPGVISGFILSFARSMGEFGATITFAGNIEGITRTLPLALYSFLQVPGQEMASARLAVISVVISLIAMAVSEVFNRKAKRKIQ